MNWKGVYVYCVQLVHPSVQRIHKIVFVLLFFTTLATSMSCLHLSTNFRSCVLCNSFFKFQNLNLFTSLLRTSYSGILPVSSHISGRVGPINMEGIWINTMPDSIYDLDICLYPWGWPWILKVKVLNFYVSGIDESNLYEFINCKTLNSSISNIYMYIFHWTGSILNNLVVTLV